MTFLQWGCLLFTKFALIFLLFSAVSVRMLHFAPPASEEAKQSACGITNAVSVWLKLLEKSII